MTNAFPDKIMFKNALARLTSLEEKAGGAGSDAPWAFLDHFYRDSSDVTSSGAYGLIMGGDNTVITAKSLDTNHSGILRATCSSDAFLLTPDQTFGRYGEFEFRFNIHSALQGNSFTFEFVNASNNIPFFTLVSQSGDWSAGFVPPTYDAFHTWRIVLRPGETRLVRSDGVSSVLEVGTVGDPPTSLKLNMRLTGGPHTSGTQKVVDLDYLAWRPLPEAPLPQVAVGGSGDIT